MGGSVESIYRCLVMLVVASAIGDATARDTRAGFNVNVHLLSTAHAANIPKAAASPAPPRGASPANRLRFGVTTRAGYFVRFEILDPAVELVEIHGLGPEMRIVSGARDVFVPPDHEGRVVSYSVRVRPHAELSAAPPVRATILP